MYPASKRLRFLGLSASPDKPKITLPLFDLCDSVVEICSEVDVRRY